MNAEETIKTLKVAIAEVEWNFPMDYAVAFENAINSLNKQIPQKAIQEEYLGQYDVPVGNIYYCPSCKKFVKFEFDRREPNSNFCKNCGQALEW